MGIKKTIFFLFLFLFSFTIIIRPKETISNEKFNFTENLAHNNSPKVSSEALIDKVYTFNATYDEIQFSLNLEKRYDYYIYVEVVTPNNTCNLAITLWDLENKIFKIFQRDMISDYSHGDYDEVPFGTALSGIHQFKFNMTSNKNLNLYIRIEKAAACLYDKVDQYYLDRLLYYEVKRFYNGATTKFSVTLETDRMYRFYMGRVSAIAELSSIEKVDLNISDANNLLFLIYENILLPDVSDIFWTFFGTATSGLYDINLKLYCTEPYINVAYILSEDYQISDVIDENSTEPEEDEEPDDTLLLPEELTIGTLIFVGGITAALTLFFVQQRKKNAVKLDLNDKIR